MKKQILSAMTLALLGTTFLACTGDDSNPAAPPSTDASTDHTTTDATPGSDATPPGNDGGADTGPNTPAPPTLGAQIDRFGRPAVNTALNNSFEADATKAGAAKDAYNADSDPKGWVAKYTPEFEKNLAILDSLDTSATAGSGCGNQAFADANKTDATRYATLAGVLAADMQWVNTASTTCSQYLAVELNATGAKANTDCGGRALSYDVIEVTYSAVAGVGLSGFGSGVTAVDAKVNGKTFPYLAAPQ